MGAWGPDRGGTWVFRRLCPQQVHRALVRQQRLHLQPLPAALHILRAARGVRQVRMASA